MKVLIVASKMEAQAFATLALAMTSQIVECATFQDVKDLEEELTRTQRATHYEVVVLTGVQ